MWLALLAFGGLLVGHFMAYVVVTPDAGVRAAVLEATGHGGHGLFLPVAGAAFFAAVIGLITHQLRDRRYAGAERPNLIRLVTMLWVLQTVAFVALEVTERALASHSAAELLHEPAFLVGLVVQAIASVVGALLVVLLTATVEALCRYLRSPNEEASPSSIPDPRQAVPMVHSVASLAWNLRGPPVSPTI